MNATGRPDATRRARAAAAWFLAILTVAVALRACALGRHSLWLDEAVTWWNATRPTWLETVFAEVNHGPVWWIVTRAFVGALGDSEAALRAPAAILGVLSVFLVWQFARLLLDPRLVPSRAGFRGLDAGAPRWIAALAAVHPFWIEYSQEARMYAGVLAISLALSILYLLWLRDRSWKPLAAYALLAGLGLYTQYTIFLTLAAHAAIAMTAWRWTRGPGVRPPSPLPLLAALGVALLIASPWIARTVGAGGLASSLGSFSPVQRLAFAVWRVLMGPSWAAIDRPRIDAGAASLIREEWGALALGAAIFVPLLLLGVHALRRDGAARAFLLFHALVPPAILVSIFARIPLLHEKYLIAIAPSVLVLAVIGARSLGTNPRRIALAALFAAALAGTLAYFAPEWPPVARAIAHGHRYGKEDWRGARGWAAERVRPDDIVVLYPHYARIPWSYYDRDRLPAVALSAPALRADDPALPHAMVARDFFLVTGAIRPEMRDSVRAGLGRDSRGGRSEARESVLLPTHWGVWVDRIADPVAGAPDSAAPAPTR